MSPLVPLLLDGVKAGMCEKGSERVDYGAFADIVWAYQHIQSRLKFQLGVTQFSEVFDRQLSDT